MRRPKLYQHRSRIIRFLLSGMLLMAGVNAHGSLMVTPSSEAAAADDLADRVLGEGVTLVDDSLSFTGETGQAGTFENGTKAGLGIDQGAIMTTGKAELAVGPNDADNSGESYRGAAGDAYLDQLISESTYDAAVLEFDFRFDGGDLLLDFIFASDEYNEQINSGFHDPIAVTIDGHNIALTPDGNPVSVEAINCGADGDSPQAPNCSLFNNNDLDDSAAPFDIEYDGFTNVLTGERMDLQPGTHTARFAIADAGDRQVDSAMMLGDGSFSSEEAHSVASPPTGMLIGCGLLLLAAGWSRGLFGH